MSVTSFHQGEVNHDEGLVLSLISLTLNSFFHVIFQVDELKSQALSRWFLPEENGINLEATKTFFKKVYKIPVNMQKKFWC